VPIGPLRRWPCSPLFPFTPTRPRRWPRTRSSRQRLVNIAEELRCLVCQNESLAGSRADLAMDLRREIRGLIKQGKTDQQVRDFLVSRYGDFVLYRPPVKPTTWLLWGGPFVLLLGGLIGLVAFLRKRKPADAALSPEDQRKAEALLNGES
jgi:cytochrome c-type biogenesis protein CcmH